MTATVTQAVEKAEAPGPGSLVAQYKQTWESVLPSHVRLDAFMRTAQGALRRGNRDPRTGVFDLEQAAMNDPGVFLAALLDAARQGLAPGTEEYYLTARKVKGKSQILGITGYQGYIELMHRAGAVVSVVVEVVRENDKFVYQPGIHDIPLHEIDWDADDQARGGLRLVYAYARMATGAVSKVVVLNKADIADIKRKSTGASSEYSPWQTATKAMWMKSAVRQLKKWVPTSVEWRNEPPAVDGHTMVATIERPALVPADDIPTVDFESGDGLEPDDDVIDLEPLPDDDAPVVPDWFVPMTDKQRRHLHALLKQKHGATNDARFPVLCGLLDRDITSTNQIDAVDAQKVINLMMAQPDIDPVAPEDESF